MGKLPHFMILIATSISSSVTTVAIAESYGDIIKETSEYKKITKSENTDDEASKKQGEQKKHGNRRGKKGRRYRRGYREVGGEWILIEGHSDSDYYDAPAYYEDDSYYQETQDPGISKYNYYAGLMIGSSSFDYDDINDGDAMLLSFGLRARDDRKSYEIAYINTGNVEVRNLSDVELRVEAFSLSLSYNSAKTINSNWNAYASAGIYLADTSLSGPIDEVTEDSNGFTFGLGVECFVSEKVYLRLDVRQLFDVDDFANNESISIVTVGGKVYF